MVNPHYPRLLGGALQRDTGGKVFEGPFNPHGPLDVAQLNHYWFKSYPEWLIKRNKGHVDIDVAERGLRRLSMFADGDEHSNAVEDDSAWRFYRRLLESKEAADAGELAEAPQQQQKAGAIPVDVSLFLSA
jgi:hypothetical protein